ncbi:MAG: hypothetical protein SZ59_C0002G0118 [candidate division TM6 bacterium GW2011_GWF2_28_16]|nr:MAG: hypothetical protein SZ59_C0002G0118 [candidate division TM6 bacterium GW2011_GWF2_28_16]
MRVLLNNKKNLLFCLLIILVLPVKNYAKNTQGVTSAQVSESLQNLIVPVINQVMQQVNDRIQNQKNKNNKRENKPKKDDVHFIYNQDILPSNYFVEDRKFFINLNILKSDENFDQSFQASIDALNETLKKAGNAKKEDLIDYIIINSDTPFYTYYQYLQPGLLNVLRQDNLYKNEIERFDNVYLKYSNIIASLILNSTVDLIVYKNDDVVYEHDVIQANDGHMIDSYMIQNDVELYEIYDEIEIPTRATVAEETVIVPVRLEVDFFHYFPANFDPKQTAAPYDQKQVSVATSQLGLNVKTSDGVFGTLDLVHPLSVSLSDAVDVVASTPLDISLADQIDVKSTTGLDINPIDVDITSPLIAGRLNVQMAVV